MYTTTNVFVNKCVVKAPQSVIRESAILNPKNPQTNEPESLVLNPMNPQTNESQILSLETAQTIESGTISLDGPLMEENYQVETPANVTPESMSEPLTTKSKKSKKA